MTPQEHELILGVAQRLRNANLTHKDPEAERLIQMEIGSQKDALYLLTQAVIVQEQGLRYAQERIRQLEAASSQPAQGGFLSSLFGSSSPAPPAAPVQPVSAPPAAGGGMSSFLGTAAAAAAGAVGGQLIYDGMRHLFTGTPGASWPQGGGFLGSNPPPVSDVVNVHEPTRGGNSDGAAIEPQDTAWSGSGGDFGTESSSGSGDDTDGANSGGDFGEAEDEDSGGGDFGDADSTGSDSSGGGDF